MKLFAYYLPQFHSIPENDKWWGKGFTEWTNVKKARPLFNGHLQPKVPLNNNYYSLSDISTLRWQSSLLKNYKVDGMIFYHYYFMGKKLLEKPAELLLNNPNIPMNFFFCWANHSWKRSWEGSTKVLMEQEYGNEGDWERHFEYLLPFFKDARYEKFNNKPLFLIFDSSFKEKDRLLAFFDKRCKESGFDGICAIDTRATLNDDSIERLCKNSTAQFIHLREPSSVQDYFLRTHSFARLIHKVKNIPRKIGMKTVVKYNGNQFFNLMCKRFKHRKKIIHGLFFEWDNTPRHTYNGYVIKPVDKEHFLKYATLLEKDEYVFLNAWNEWAEGMMVEPTKENGYEYLEWIKEWREGRPQ